MAEPVTGWTEAAYTGNEVMAGDKGGGLAGDNVKLTLDGVRDYILDLGSSNVFFVGPDAKYASVTLALAAIAANADAALDNQYSVVVAAGTYTDNFTLPSYVHISGQGAWATRFENTSRVAISGVYCSLNNLYIGRDASSTTATTVQRAGWVNQVQINDCEIEAVNRGTALDLTEGSWTGDELQTFFINRCKIISKETAIRHKTAAYFRDCTIIVHDDQGIIEGNTWDMAAIRSGGGRAWFWGCTIGQGYNNPQEFNGDGLPSYEVFGDRNLYSLYYEDSIDNANLSRNGRIAMWNTHCYTRNETDTTVTGKDIQCIRLISGWVRLFGCLFQCETTGANINKLNAVMVDSAMINDNGGTGIKQRSLFEDYGCRITRVVGDGGISSPESNVGFQELTVADNGKRFNKFEGGVKLCDCTGGSFTLQLPLVQATDTGQAVEEKYTFVITDDTANTVTLSTSDGGGSSPPIGYGAGALTTYPIPAAVNSTVTVVFNKPTHTWVVL